MTRYSKKNSAYTLLDTDIIQDPRLSLEAIGVYGMLESGCLKIEQLPTDIFNQLKEIGYIDEVQE